MRKTRSTNGFTALRIEGGIFPPEFLQIVATQEAKQQSSSDYGISRSLNLKDELARYWRIANDLYTTYTERSQRADLDPEKVGVTEWLIPFLQDVLGYRDIEDCGNVDIRGRQFPITHHTCNQTVPLVLTTRNFDLDRSDPRFGEEGRRRSPHALMQEYLNAADNCLWGLISNGTRLRLLRDNPSLTRPAYFEADLELIFQEQLYSDFAAMWLMLHATRLKPVDGKPNLCILESWRKAAHETGERALEKLREGVTEALRQLGNGFIQHPRNGELRKTIAEGQLTAYNLFQELLRLVYRFLFLFTVEERNLLHPPQATEEQRAIYREGYSLARLRELAIRRRYYDQHSDLWRAVQIVFRGLARGAQPLGLNAFGGLFAEEQCPTLDKSRISNERLLEAIRALSYFRSNDTLTRINYRDMDTEELGSVYESLLELHPYIDVEAQPWIFGFVNDITEGSARGSDRRLTGSYYTPSSLVNELIQSTLEPVMAEAIAKRPDNPRAALLELKIIDPACGSGHFLLAAARRMAAEIAKLESDTDTPDELVRQRTLRDVVQHCIYGVDRNPLSVELCRTALWIETVDPEKPLTFLDSHIQCGDSLVGILDPKMLEDGIPDDAYAVLTGDDRNICNELRRKNRQSRSSVQMNIFDQENAQPFNLAIDQMPEETLEDIEAKRKVWEAARENTAWWQEEFRANLYVAAFFAPKTKVNSNKVPVNEDLNRVRLGITMSPGLEEFVTKLARKHRFLHWYLAFPEIMKRGGFDVVIGNPPWERIKLQEQEFFASRSPEIANAPNKAVRERLIRALSRTDATPAEKALYHEFQEAKREAEAASQFIRTSGRYPRTGVGDVNTYAVFAETFMNLIAPSGRAGLIVPTGIATDNSTKKFFEEVSTKGRLVSLYDFENREAIFSGVHRSYKFCLLTLGHNVPQAQFVFFATNVEQLHENERRFSLSPDDIRLINPNTKTCPVFRSKADAELTKKLYSRVPVLIDENKGEEGNPWGISFMRMFDMANDSGLFRTFEQLSAEGARLIGNSWVDTRGEIWVPLYEAKMIHQFDHRWATYKENGKDCRDVTEDEKGRTDFEPLPRYWVPQREVEERLASKGWKRQWLMGWRKITNATNERTIIASFLPIVGIGDSMYIQILDSRIQIEKVLALFGNISTLVCDFIARQKIGGTNLNFFIAKQFAIIPPDYYKLNELDFITPRVMELVYTSESMRPFAQDIGYEGPSFAWNPERRAVLRAELDAYYAHLYGLTRDELRYILDPAEVYGEDYPSETFRVLKQNEIGQFGEYRTQRLVLQAWDRLVAEGRIPRNMR